jgi:hypothetical protein
VFVLVLGGARRFVSIDLQLVALVTLTDRGLKIMTMTTTTTTTASPAGFCYYYYYYFHYYYYCYYYHYDSAPYCFHRSRRRGDLPVYSIPSFDGQARQQRELGLVEGGSYEHSDHYDH